MKPHALIATTFLVAAMAPAAAQSANDPALVGALQRCRAIVDRIERVGCYDAVVARIVAEPAAAATSATPPTAARPAPATSATAAIPVPAPAAAPAASEFGLPSRPAPVVAPEALDSRIAGTFDGWGPGGRITLVNGQVWQVSDGSSFAGSDLKEPAVRITRGTLGSYFMKIDGVAPTPRVRRVK